MTSLVRNHISISVISHWAAYIFVRGDGENDSWFDKRVKKLQFYLNSYTEEQVYGNMKENQPAKLILIRRFQLIQP